MRILQSYRWRRRFVRLAILAALVPLIYLGMHYSSPGKPPAATGPASSVYVEPKRAPFTAEKQQAVRPVLREFIRTAVAREDVARSWDLAAPNLKEGVTRKQWNEGKIPVVPYPAADRGLGTWSFVEYSYTNAVGLEVFLFPKPGSGFSALTADVELVRRKDGQWLVDYWMPKRFHGPPARAAKVKTRNHGESKRKRRAPVAAPALVEPPRPSRLWWAIPLGLLSLIFIVPITIGLLVWYRNRKAERDYLRSIGQR